MIVAVHQPSFLPWIGFWNKLMVSDLFILMTGVKYSHGDYQNRVKMNGSWVSMPVIKETKSGLIKDVQVDIRAFSKIAKTIVTNFGGKKWKYRDRIHSLVSWLERTKCKWLAEVNRQLIYLVLEVLSDPPGPIIVADSVVSSETTKSKRLCSLIRRHVSGEIAYFTGAGALNYYDPSDFDRDIRVFVQSVAPDVSSESIIELLVSEDDPASIVCDAATWGKYGE